MLSAPVPRLLGLAGSCFVCSSEEFHADIFRIINRLELLYKCIFNLDVYTCIYIYTYINVSYLYTESIQESWSMKNFRSFNTVIPAFILPQMAAETSTLHSLQFANLRSEPSFRSLPKLFSKFRKCPLSWHHRYIHGISPTLHVGSAPSKWWEGLGSTPSQACRLPWAYLGSA